MPSILKVKDWYAHSFKVSNKKILGVICWGLELSNRMMIAWDNIMHLGVIERVL